MDNLFLFGFNVVGIKMVRVDKLVCLDVNVFYAVLKLSDNIYNGFINVFICIVFFIIK